MILETIIACALLVVGEGYLRLAGIRSFVLRVVGAIPTGSALTVATGLLLLLLGIPAVPAHVLAATTLAAVVWPLVNKRKLSSWLKLAAPIAALTVLVPLITASKLANLTPDSWTYAWSGSLFAQYGSAIHHQAGILERRSLGIPYINGIAGTTTNELMLQSFTPLLAISVIGIIGFVSFRLLKLRGASHFSSSILAFLIVGLILTTNRFVYHAFYLNSHMWFAAASALVVGVVLLALWGDQSVPSKAIGLAVIPSLIAMVLIRPEGGLVACLIVAPIVIGKWDRVTNRDKIWVLASLGSILVLWNGLFLWPRFDWDPPTSVIAMTGLGLILVTAALLPNILARASRRMLLPLALLTLLAVGGVFALRDPSIARLSVAATYENVLRGEGLWGFSLVLVVLLLCLTLIFRRSDKISVTLFPLASFLPLALLLAYLRDGAYRVGAGDSLNRMFIHFLPVAALLLVDVLAGTSRLSRTPSRRPDDDELRFPTSRGCHR